MMRLGVHLSIGEGLRRTAQRAIELRCQTLQIFSRSPGGWFRRREEPAELDYFLATLSSADIRPLIIHTPYLLNLASPDSLIIERTQRVLSEELSLAAHWGAQFVNTHIGSHKGEGTERGLERIERVVGQALRGLPSGVTLLLENGSGVGNSVGSTFEELARLMAAFPRHSEALGITLDTAHLWGAGYDLSSKDAVDSVFLAFDRVVGLRYLRLIHLNDSLAERGSRRDRHWHIGQGKIGLVGLAAFLGHSAVAELPIILETPRMGSEEDERNLEVVRGMLLMSS